MIGRIVEIVDNSVTIKLEINISEQPNLVNLHVVFDDGSGRSVVAEVANVNQEKMLANIVGEIENGVFTPGSSVKPSFKSQVRLIKAEELALLFGNSETEFGYTNFGDYREQKIYCCFISVFSNRCFSFFYMEIY